MGADLRVERTRLVSGEPVGDVIIVHAPLSPCRIGSDQVPAIIDEIPALAVACAFADGESRIEGLGELRHKESDRLVAIAAGLAACGVEVAIEGDALRIVGRRMVNGGTAVATRGDHRIAMAFLTLGLGARAGVAVDRAEMIATSFPGYVRTMRALGARIDEER